MRRFLHSLGKGMGETTFEALKEKALSLPLKPWVSDDGEGDSRPYARL